MTDVFLERYLASAVTPRLARQDVTTYLLNQRRSELNPTVTLLVSEVVTNAVMHGGGTIELRARFVGSVLHVEVVDDGDTVPRTRQAADSGYGLHILEAFVAAWGVDRISGGGKVTWFDLETNPTPLDGS